MIKNTPLTEKHLALGAKMAPFAGYNMPISYVGIKEEHLTVRQSVGVFDVSHMGEFLLEGTAALDLIQRITTNDASKLQIGDAQYSCMPNHDGGIVDDLLVYRIAADRYMLVVNASNIEKDWAWVEQHNSEGVEMKNLSDDFALLAVQGPKAVEALQSLTSTDLTALKYYTFVIGTMAGIENVIISATGYTGAGGFELYVPAEHAATLWDAVFAAGEPLEIRPIGLGARDTLRLEMGYCLYGNDIDDTTSPLEAGLGWITKLKKGNFNSSDLFNQQKKQGVAKKLVGFEMVERGIARHDYEICDAQDNVIGRVTSGTQSPSLDKAVGLGYVPAALSALGSEFFVSIRNKKVKARVVKVPFE